MTPYVEYEISTGRIVVYDATDTPTLLGIGYSGNGPCINDPDKTWVVGHGPIPLGLYLIGSPEEHPESVGAYALPLTPDPANSMFGRGGFFIHGDNPQANHSASDGCIVANRAIRTIIATYQTLEVTA